MAKFQLKAGAELDLLTADEVRGALADANDRAEIARLSGLKHMRLPKILIGTAASSALSMGEDTGKVLGPRVGYVWTLRRLVLTGLTTGATPDVMNLLRGGTTGEIIWQFNGNNFAYTFGRLEQTLYGGETLALASVGTFASTSQVTLSGELVEVPAELIGKLA